MEEKMILTAEEIKKLENGIANCEKKLRDLIIAEAETIAEAILQCEFCTTHYIHYELRKITDDMLFITRYDVNPCLDYETFQVDIYTVFDVDDFVDYVKENFMREGDEALIIDYLNNKKYKIIKEKQEDEATKKIKEEEETKEEIKDFDEFFDKINDAEYVIIRKDGGKYNAMTEKYVCKDLTDIGVNKIIKKIERKNCVEAYKKLRKSENDRYHAEIYQEDDDIFLEIEIYDRETRKTTNWAKMRIGHIIAFEDPLIRSWKIIKYFLRQEERTPLPR